MDTNTKLKHRRGQRSRQVSKRVESVYCNRLVSAHVPIFYFGIPEVTSSGYESVPLCGSGVHNPSLLTQPERVSFIQHDSYPQQPGDQCAATMDLDVELNALDMEHIAMFEKELGKAVEEHCAGRGMMGLMNRERHTLRCWMTRRDRRMMEMWHNRHYLNVTHFRLEWSWLHCGFGDILPTDISPGDILFPESHQVFAGPPRAIPLWPSDFADNEEEEPCCETNEIREEPPVKRRRRKIGVVTFSSSSSPPSIPELEKVEMNQDGIEDSSTCQTRGEVLKQQKKKEKKKKTNVKTSRAPATSVERMKKRQTKRKRTDVGVETMSFSLGDDLNGNVLVELLTSVMPSSPQNSSGCE